MLSNENDLNKYQAPAWQTCPGVFFVWVGQAHDLEQWKTSCDTIELKVIQIDDLWSDKTWFSKKFFRKRVQNQLEFPIPFDDEPLKIGSPAELSIEEKRNFIFNLDLLKQEHPLFAVVIPPRLLDQYLFLMEHLGWVISSHEENLTKVPNKLSTHLAVQGGLEHQGEIIDLNELNEYLWRINAQVVKPLYYKFLKQRTFWFVLALVAFMFWPEELKEVSRSYKYQSRVASKQASHRSYFNIKNYDQYRRVIRSYLFHNGFAFHSSDSLPGIVQRFSSHFLDSTQLTQLDISQQILKVPLGQLELPNTLDSLQFGDKLKVSEVKYYQKWVGMLNDSLAYPTDYFWEGDDSHRIHRGIDIAGRMDSRIHSPISGTAIIGESDRAGRFVAVVDSIHVVFFAHCDKYLFLNGEEVRVGDPVATVGLTGHTTGPHVHIGTGYVSERGAHSLGNTKFDYVDPVEWLADLQKKGNR